METPRKTQMSLNSLLEKSAAKMIPQQTPTTQTTITSASNTLAQQQATINKIQIISEMQSSSSPLEADLTQNPLKTINNTTTPTLRLNPQREAEFPQEFPQQNTTQQQKQRDTPCRRTLKSSQKKINKQEYSILLITQMKMISPSKYAPLEQTN